MNQVSQLTPMACLCLDTIQKIVAKLGGDRETCLAIASLGNSHPDEDVLEELNNRLTLLNDFKTTYDERCEPPLGETGEAYYCKRDEFSRYIEDQVNPARKSAGLQSIDLKAAEECYRILNDLARHKFRDQYQDVHNNGLSEHNSF